MINSIKKYLYKRKALDKKQEILWDLRIQEAVQRRILRMAVERKITFEEEVNEAEEKIKPLMESTKYDDRMKRKELEDELNEKRQRLEMQDREIKTLDILLTGGRIGDKRYSGTKNEIKQAEREMEIIKEDF